MAGLLTLGALSCRGACQFDVPEPSTPGPAGSPPATTILERLRLANSGDTEFLVSRVVQVVDGDTVVIRGGETVRYVGIDAPERDRPFHRQAGEFHRRLVEGREVVIVSPREDRRDRYGRVLGAVFLAPSDGGEDGDGAGERTASPVAVELVRRGLAWVYIKESDGVTEALRPLLLEAQAQAIDARAGVWSLPGAIEGDGRRVRITRNRFHRSDCRHLIGQTRPLMGRQEALRSGRSPCRTCKP